MSMSESDEGELEYETVGLSSTCYDGTAIALVSAFDPGYASLHGAGPTIIQFVFALFMHLSSISLQFIMVYGLLVTTVAGKEEPYRHNLDGITMAIQAALESDPPIPLSGEVPLERDALNLCSKRQNVAMSHFLILFLWATKMSGEVVDTLLRLRIILRLPAADWEQPLLELTGRATEDGGKAVIVRANLLMRVIFVLFISFPQMLACTFLAWTGAKFLFYTGDMGTLIMKSIGLAFIVTLDELLYTTFASARFQMLVSNSSYKIYAGRPNWHWEMWGLSVLKVGCVLLFTIFIWLVVFRKVTELRHMCDLYDARFWDGKETNTSAWEEFLSALNVA